VGTQTEEGGTLCRGGTSSPNSEGLQPTWLLPPQQRSTQAPLFHSLKAIARHGSEIIMPGIALGHDLPFSLSMT
jgi:hypothetical protein